MKTVYTIFFLAVIFHGSAQRIVDYDLVNLDSIKKPLSDYRHTFSAQKDSSYNSHKNRWNYSILPEITSSYDGKNLNYLGDVLLNLYIPVNNKLKIYGAGRLGYTNAENQIYTSRMQPTTYFDRLFQDVKSRIIYTPNRYIKLQTGLDKHFIGQGDRSLLMGDQGIASPFAMIQAKLWKLEYCSIQQILREGRTGHFRTKGSSTHFLNFRHKHHFSIGIFETVTHLIKDTLYNRGFDIEYLNPFTFYRPQEYSLGSSDNVILGLNTHVKFGKSVLYGQLVLDEFLLSAIRSRNRWWANKYGIQIGYKFAKVADNKSSFLRTELTLIRPYTFSHLNNSLNYGTQGLPVAHPLGSNLIEWYSEHVIQTGSWTSQSWFQIYLKGMDPETDSLSYGGDIYQSYINRPIGEFGILIGNGEHTVTWQFGNRTSYALKRKLMEVFVEPRFFITRTKQNINSQLYLTIGIQSSFGSRLKN